jgi:outer membrane autotransporter protein
MKKTEAIKTKMFTKKYSGRNTSHVWSHGFNEKPNVLLAPVIAVLDMLAVLTGANGQVSLGTADSFAVIAHETITNSGPTVITGDLGLSPGTSITGFPPGIVIGTIHNSDVLATQARTDANSAYNTLAGLTTTSNLSGQNLGGMILSPGVYQFNSSAGLTGALTLATGADPNAVFVFKIGSTLTTGANSSVIVTGAGALTDAHIFWQVGSSATLKTNTTFDGNVIALTSISLGTGTIIVNGRVIALNGAVTLLSNTIMISATSIISGSSASFTSVPDLTPNETAVGAALDYYAAKHPLNPVTTYIAGQIAANPSNPAYIRSLYDLIAPDELTAIFTIGFSGADVQNSNIERHLEQVREGSSGYTSTGFVARSNDGKTIVDGKNVVVDKNPATPESKRWSFFIEGSGEFASVGSFNNASGYDFTTAGVTMGVDYRVNDNFAVGILGGYANTHADLVNQGGININSGKTGVYATVFGNGFYADALVGTGYNSYDTTRSSLLGYAYGDANGWELDTLINGGYDFHQGNWTFGPVASVAYTQINLDRFTETGSLTPLSYPDQSQNSLRTNLGLKIDYTATVKGIKITPQVRVSWQHEYLDSTQSIGSSFATAGSPVFAVSGPQMGRDSALVSAGVNVRFTPTISVYAYYDGQLGRTNYSSNSVTGGVKIDF